MRLFLKKIDCDLIGGVVMTNEELVERIQQGIDPGNNIDQLYQQNYRLIFQIVRKFAYKDEMEIYCRKHFSGCMKP